MTAPRYTITPHGAGWLVKTAENQRARGEGFARAVGLRYIPAQGAWFGGGFALRRWKDLMESDCQIVERGGRKYYEGSGYRLRDIAQALDRIRHPVGSRRVRVDVERGEGLRLADAAEAAGLTITASRIRAALGIEKINAVALRFSL